MNVCSLTVSRWALSLLLTLTLFITCLLVTNNAMAQEVPTSEPTPTISQDAAPQAQLYGNAVANSWENASPIRSRFPMVRCGEWGSTRPYSVMREGSWEDVKNPAVMNFGIQKAKGKHDIVDPVKLWHRTLLVAQLGGGCVGRGNDRGGAAAAAKFIGFVCTWGERHCVIDPLRRRSVVSVEVGRDNPNIKTGLADKDQRIGNLSLHCVNADRSKACPSWIYGAMPYAADNPDSPILR